jgi:hypothetical protein
MNESLTRLQPGMVVLFNNAPATVVRVNDCSAAIRVSKPPKDFVTADGVQVHIESNNTLVRISPNSMIPIL